LHLKLEHLIRFLDLLKIGLFLFVKD